MQQDDQRAFGRGAVDATSGALRLHDVEANPVGVHLEMSPRTVDADDRRIGRGHYQPDGSVAGSLRLPSDDVSALS